MGDDPTAEGELVEIVNGNTVWRFETEFLTSNWTCLYGRGCKGILDHDATELGQGCCSLGAHFGDGPAGEAEAMTVSAYASMIEPERFHVARLFATQKASCPPQFKVEGTKVYQTDVYGRSQQKLKIEAQQKK